MKHTLVATMDNNPFTFNRVISLFRSRGFVIDSLTIGQTDVQDMMRLTIVVDGSRTAVEQVVKQLYKVVEVRKVSDLSEDQPVVRELALIKVTSKPTTRARDHAARGHLPRADRRCRARLGDDRGDGRS